MLQLHPEALTPGEARDLLRMLRDLNLAGRVAVSGREVVQLKGCLSLDTPVEQGVRYRLRRADGPELVLDLGWDAGMLLLSLQGERERHPRRIATVVMRDEQGRALAPGLRARMPLSVVEGRKVERFMRRIVRASWRALAA